VAQSESEYSDYVLPTILEEDLQSGVLKAINQVTSDSNGSIEVLEHNFVLGGAFGKDIAKIKINLWRCKIRL
jgi:hypothetical protein